MKEIATAVLISGKLALIGEIIGFVTRVKVVSLLMPIGGILVLAAGDVI